MKCKLGCCFLIMLLALWQTARADLTGTQKIRDHIDGQLVDIRVETLSPEEKKAWLVNPLRLNLNMLVPVYGSFILDTTLYGNIRPPAYVFDWILGGGVPLCLLLWVILFGKRLTSVRRKTLIGFAIGLYLVTRIGVFITINEHIHQYNKYMKIRLEMVDSA